MGLIKKANAPVPVAEERKEKVTKAEVQKERMGSTVAPLNTDLYPPTTVANRVQMHMPEGAEDQIE